MDNENGREKANQENEERISGRRDALHNNREAGGNISVSFNDGRSESLRTITSKEKSKQISEIASAIYYNATNEIQNNLKCHCKYEGIELFFLKTKEGVEQSFVYDGKNLFVKENTTEKKLVDILDIIKPINRTVDENKIAHISNNRWDNFINNHSGAYLTRISIQQFLDMTTESYVDQRQINARSESISRQANVNVSDTYQEEIYLEIDFNTKKVVNHEGRHRLTSLLNQGNAFVDIFITPTQKLNIETITNIEIEGQFNNNKYKLSVVKAESVIFKDAIYNSFRREDNNIRYSLKDSDDIKFSYKKKRTASYINNRLSVPTLSFIRNELKNIYGPVDSAIADGIAIEKDNTIYVVDSGIEDSKIDFGVLYYIEIADDNLRYKNMEEINDRAVSKGHVDNEISKKIRRSPNNGSDSSIGRELSKELSDNTRKSENNESGIFEKDATNGSRRLKFSLKDSEKSLNEKISGLKPIQIKDEKEYQRLERELEHRNGNHPSKIDWALTDKYLYIVKDNTYDSFTPIVKIDCKKYYNFFIHLTKMIDYSNYNPIKTIDAWMTEIFAHPDSIEWFNPDPLYISYNKQIVDNEIATALDKEAESSNYKNKDSFGRELSEQQIEYFKDSKVRDRYGRLREVYHGTYGEFYTFDKSLLGKNVNSPDAKLGFFFTASKRLAEDYSSHAKDRKLYNLMYKVANGDAEVLRFLSETSNFYDNEKIKNIIETKEYSEINKIKELEKNNKHDVFSVYLDIKNPYIEDWKKKMHSGINMVRAITKALTNGFDGVIIKRVNASITEDRPADDLYVVFDSNQIKDVNNRAPTKNPDIRFSLKEYSDVQKKNWENSKKIIIYENETQFKNIINESLNNNQYDKKIYFGAIDSNLGKYIFEKTGLNLENYNCSLQTNEIRKIIKSHSNDDIESKHGQRAITNEDILNIPNVIQNPTDIIRSDKDYDGKPVIHFVKQISNEKTTVVAVVSDKHLDLRVQTEYVGIKKRNLATPINEQAFIHTPEATRGTVSNSSIRNSEENVNTNLENFSNHTKASSNANPTYTLSDGQVKKKVANFTKLKVYSKVEAESIINSILETNFSLEDYSVRISGKTKAEAIDVFWKTLNTADAGKRTGISLKVADYIIDNTIIENIYLEEENQIYTETISFLKPYLHSVDLSALKGEIKYRYDNDNSVYLLWGKRKGEDGYTADQIAKELAERGLFMVKHNKIKQ